MNFGIAGAGAYIAERHMRAIQDVGGTLLRAWDIVDVNVGKMDKYDLFTEFEIVDGAFGHEMDMSDLDFLVICTPNHSHHYIADHALANCVNVICEKPLCLSVAEAVSLGRLADEVDASLNVIQQLRNHATTHRLVDVGLKSTPENISVIYHAPRGSWYHKSWKGCDIESGGLIFNIGIHVIDALILAFGAPGDIGVVCDEPEHLALSAKFGGTAAKINLSVSNKLPPMRGVVVEDGPCEGEYYFDKIDGLHSIAYAEIVNGRGYGVGDVLPALEFCARVNEVRDGNDQ